MSKKAFNVKFSESVRTCFQSQKLSRDMNIRRKPDYRAMSPSDYLDLVFYEIEKRVGEDGAGLLMMGYNTHIVSHMINDACDKFRFLNLSPAFTANQVIRLMIETNMSHTDKTSVTKRVK